MLFHFAVKQNNSKTGKNCNQKKQRHAVVDVLKVTLQQNNSDYDQK